MGSSQSNSIRPRFWNDLKKAKQIQGIAKWKFKGSKVFSHHRNKLNIFLFPFGKSCFATNGIRWIAWISHLYSFPFNIINWQTFQKFRPVWPRLDPEKNDLTRKEGVYLIMILSYFLSYNYCTHEILELQTNRSKLLKQLRSPHFEDFFRNCKTKAFQHAYLHLNINCLFCKTCQICKQINFTLFYLLLDILT